MKLQDFDFRVWDDIENELLYPSKDYRLALAFSDPELGFNGESLLHVYYDNEPMCVDSCEIEVYTGLKDKNGVKIFVGDILQDDRGERVVVAFQRADFFHFKPNAIFLNDETLEILLKEKRVQVIGNIHENADLLEGGTHEV